MAERQSGDPAPLSPVKYIDDLAGEDDYWLSITDAARATRRQDVTIRTWIAKGLLPVRRRSVGLNKRTRQVRASDLKQLTEIIDPTAAITSDEGKLDLVSIPVQQQQILAEYKQVTVQGDALLKQLGNLATRIQQTLAEQQERSTSALAQLHISLTEQQGRTQEALAQLQAVLSAAMTQQQEAQGILLNVVEAGAAKQQDTSQTYQATLLTHLTQQSQQAEVTQSMLGTLQAQLAEQSMVLSRSIQETATLFQHQSDIVQAFEQRVSTTITQLVHRLDTTQGAITQRLEDAQEAIIQQLSTLANRQGALEAEVRQSFTAFTQQLGTLFTPLAQQLTMIGEQQTLLSQYVQAALTRTEQPDLPSGTTQQEKGRRARGKSGP